MSDNLPSDLHKHLDRTEKERDTLRAENAQLREALENLLPHAERAKDRDELDTEWYRSHVGTRKLPRNDKTYRKLEHYEQTAKEAIVAIDAARAALESTKGE